MPAGDTGWRPYTGHGWECMADGYPVNATPHTNGFVERSNIAIRNLVRLQTCHSHPDYVRDPQCEWDLPLCTATGCNRCPLQCTDGSWTAMCVQHIHELAVRNGIARAVDTQDSGGEPPGPEEGPAPDDSARPRAGGDSTRPRAVDDTNTRAGLPREPEVTNVDTSIGSQLQTLGAAIAAGHGADTKPNQPCGSYAHTT